MNYVICKEECGSMSTTFYKHRKYRYVDITQSLSLFDVMVYNEIGNSVYFFKKEFDEKFFTEKSLRKEKLKKLNNL